MISAPIAAVSEARAELRTALVARGFTDDGDLLRGPVQWNGPDGATTATVDITVPARYPFGPPVVRLQEIGANITITFHIDPDEALCLWDNSEPAGDASWTNPDALLARIAGWLEQTAAGWPDDDDTDLERYLTGPRAPKLVLYDADALDTVTGCVRTTADDRTITIHAEPRQPPAQSRSRKRARKTRHGKTSLPRRQQHLAYVADLGTVDAPIRNWKDLAAVLTDARDVRRYINQGAVELLALRYRRGTAAGLLVAAATPGRDGNPPQLHPCLAADTSLSSRTLRAGPQARALAKGHVTIVGCGAVGSYVADLLYREGVRRFVLVDPDIYRPGNVIRHAAPAHLVGQSKVQAVADALLALDLGTPQITFNDERLSTPENALRLVGNTDVVVDATADERATALLRWASYSTGRPVISACIQRDGGIARADRFPPAGGEEYLPAVPPLPGHTLPIRERGCGDAVSAAPPTAVVAAAELAVELARDQLTLDQAAPASIVRILQPQPDEPYHTITTMTSAVHSAPVSS